jgi:hypothetical protein
MATKTSKPISKGKQPKEKKPPLVDWKATKTDIRKKQFIDALEKCMGVITTACATIGIHRSTYYDWIHDDPDFKKQVESIDEIALDFAESKLFSLIDGPEHLVATKDGGMMPVKDTPNVTAVIFYLKTKGKKRGYIEKQEIDMTNRTPDFSEFTTQQIIDLLNGKD